MQSLSSHLPGREDPGVLLGHLSPGLSSRPPASLALLLRCRLARSRRRHLPLQHVNSAAHRPGSSSHQCLPSVRLHRLIASVPASKGSSLALAPGRSPFDPKAPPLDSSRGTCTGVLSPCNPHTLPPLDRLQVSGVETTLVPTKHGTPHPTLSRPSHNRYLITHTGMDTPPQPVSPTTTPTACPRHLNTIPTVLLLTLPCTAPALAPTPVLSTQGLRGSQTCPAPQSQVPARASGHSRGHRMLTRSFDLCFPITPFEASWASRLLYPCPSPLLTLTL